MPSLSHCNSSPPTVLPSSQRTVNQINELVHWPHTHTQTHAHKNTNPSLVSSFDFVGSFFRFCWKAFKFTSRSFLSRLSASTRKGKQQDGLASCGVTFHQVTSISCRWAQCLWCVLSVANCHTVLLRKLYATIIANSAICCNLLHLV